MNRLSGGFFLSYVTAASPWPTAEPAHAQQNEQALLPSLNRSLNEYTFHTLAVVASGIQRVFANVVAILGQAKRQSRADDVSGSGNRIRQCNEAVVTAILWFK